MPNPNVDAQFRPRLYSMFMDALSPTLAGVRYAATDYEPEARKKGETITVQITRKPDPDRVTGYTEALTPEDGKYPDPEFFPIKLEHYFARRVQIGAKEFHEVTEGVLPSELETAAQDMGEFINRAVLRMYKQCPYGYVSATPFDGNNLDDLKAINARASRQRMPTRGMGGRGRVMLLSSDTHAEAGANERLSDYNRTGLPPGMDDIEAFRARSYDWVLDQQVQSNVAGTRKNGGTFQTNGAVAEGAKSITIDATANTLKDGDIITVDAEGKQPVGVVSEDVAANGVTVNLYHGALRAVADNTRLYAYGSTPGHANNLVMAPGAIQMAFRLPTNPFERLGRDVMAVQDKYTGVPVLMRTWLGDGLSQVAFIILFGMGVPQPERMMRLISND